VDYGTGSGHQAAYSLQLRDFLALLRRRKWLVAIVTVLVVGAAVFYASRQTPIYKSRAGVLVKPIGPMSSMSFYYGPVNMETERGVATSTAVAELASKDLDSAVAPQVLLSGLAVSAVPDSEIMTFYYSSINPHDAQVRAQAFANAYLEFRRTRALEQAQSQAQDLEAQLQDLDQKLAANRRKLKQTSDPAQLSVLSGYQANLSAKQGIIQQQMDNLTGQNAIQGGGGEVLQNAALPTRPASPDAYRAGTLALLVGLALGSCLALGRERLDDRLSSRRDFEHQVGATILATIPRVGGPKKKSEPEPAVLEAPRGWAAEAYRVLRANVQFLGREQGVRTIVVTSGEVGDGKTTTVANLAVSLAQAGKKVIAVCCDLRKPKLHSFFGLDNSSGMTDLLAGAATPADVIQRTDVENLRVIASGVPAPNPAELLSSEQMEALMKALRNVADFIIFDTPPVLAVADALVLGPKADGVIVVADAGTATRSGVRHVRQELEQVGSRIIGGVFNNFDPGRSRYYAPEYRYRYPGYYSAYHEEGRGAAVDAPPNGQSAREAQDIRTQA